MDEINIILISHPLFFLFFCSSNRQCGSPANKASTARCTVLPTGGTDLEFSLTPLTTMEKFVIFIFPITIHD